jgi:hypothetical protein
MAEEGAEVVNRTLFYVTRDVLFLVYKEVLRI